LAFENIESNAPPKLSLIHQSRAGEVARKLNPLTFLDFASKVSELVTFLYEKFEDKAEAIVSRSLAEEIVKLKI
jgi:hypothetical protein